MENTTSWCGYKWLLQERWGQVHSEKNYMWYDPSAVTILDNGDLKLDTKYNPKEFNGFTSNIGWFNFLYRKIWLRYIFIRGKTTER